MKNIANTPIIVTVLLLAIAAPGLARDESKEIWIGETVSVPLDEVQITSDKTVIGVDDTSVATATWGSGNTGPVIIKVRSPVIVRGRVELPEEIGENHDLSLIITPVEWNVSSLAFWELPEGCLFVPVNKKTSSFEIKDVVPGRYKVSFSITSYNRSKRWEGKSIESMNFEVPPGGTKNLVLTPKVKE